MAGGGWWWKYFGWWWMVMGRGIFSITHHLITRVNGWKNIKIPDCTIAELLMKLLLTVLLQIILMIHPMKKSYSQVTKMTKEVRHRERKMMKQRRAMRISIVTQLQNSNTTI